MTNAEQSAKVIDAPPNMKALIALTFILILGWTAAVTFFGPELYRAINGPEPVKAKVIRRAR